MEMAYQAGLFKQNNFKCIAKNTHFTNSALSNTIGCQVINLSLGIQNSWPEDAMSVVADRLANNGVIGTILIVSCFIISLIEHHYSCRSSRKSRF
jgi:hypothetical protein